MKISKIVQGGVVLVSLAAFASVSAPAKADTLQPPDSDALVAGYQLIRFDLKECSALLGSQKGAPANSNAILSPSITAIAAKMCKSAHEYQPKLDALAKEKNFELPTSLPYDLNARYAALVRNQSGNLGQQYLEDQIDSHTTALAVFQEEVATGKDPDVKAAAAQVIPTIQENLNALKTLAAKQ
jgi:putative membrane protein